MGLDWGGAFYGVGGFGLLADDLECVFEGGVDEVVISGCDDAFVGFVALWGDPVEVSFFCAGVDDLELGAGWCGERARGGGGVRYGDGDEGDDAELE